MKGALKRLWTSASGPLRTRGHGPLAAPREHFALPGVPVNRWESVAAAVLAFVLLMGLSSGILAQKYNAAYKALMVGAVVLTAFKRNLFGTVFSRSARPLLIGLIVFVCLTVFFPDRYGRNSALTCARGLILFACGVSLAAYPQRFRTLILASCGALLALACLLQGGLPGVGPQYSSRLDFVAESADKLGMGDRGTSFKENITNFVSYLAFVSLLLVSAFDSRSLGIRALAIAMFTAALAVSVAFMWTAPVMILLFGLVLILLHHVTAIPAKRVGGLLSGAAVAALVAGSVALTLTLAGRFEYGEGEVRARRLEMITGSLALGRGSLEQWDDASSGRLKIMSRSIEAFLQSPVWGIGDSRHISGHSSFLDAFARFGLLGGVPVAVILVFYVSQAAVLARREPQAHWTAVSCAGMMSMFLIMSFLNPIFMTANAEIVFFLVAGFVTARGDLWHAEHDVSSMSARARRSSSRRRFRATLGFRPGAIEQQP